MENLFTCPDCGNQVSNNAKSCPNCGNNKIQKQIRKHKWDSMEPEKKKRITITGVVVIVLYVVLVGLFGERKPSACGCIENLNLGYYDALNETDRKMRDKCNEAYAGPATLYIECQKEKGEWKGK